MKTIALALRTDSTSVLTPVLIDRLQEINMDKRLKKAEAIKAYLGSDVYLAKRIDFQKMHAEFGKIGSVALSDDQGFEFVKGEKKSLTLINDRLVGVERLIVFDSDHCLSFIMKRAMLTGHPINLREKLYSNFGTAGTAVIDIKKLWAGPSKEYSSLTLRQLVNFVDSVTMGMGVEDEANAILELYEDMKGYLVS